MARREIPYLKCPFCGRSTPVGVIERRLDPDFVIETDIYQIREVSGGPGRGKHEKGTGGFKLTERREWSEFERDYPELAANLKKRWRTTVRQFREIMK